MHNKGLSVVGILSDEADPLVSVMKARARHVPQPTRQHRHTLASSRALLLRARSAALRVLTTALRERGHHAQVEKAPLESYADIGGLEDQIQEIKEAVELPLTHPELYTAVPCHAPCRDGC